MNARFLALLALLVVPFSLFIQLSSASYAVTNINTTVVLNQNSSARVSEILEVAVSNQSVSQYSTDRLALNLTLSQWQLIIGPNLVQHIINPHGSIYNFNFLPGPIVSSPNGRVAYLLMTYYVNNVTVVNQTGPRTFLYSFNNDVFNFQHAASGAVLGENTTLTVIVPQGSKIMTVVPSPDSPAQSFTQNYKNVTVMSWYADEPLSKFQLVYTTQESLQDEVLSFFAQLYKTLGVGVYVLILAVIAAIIVYTYLKVGK